MNYNYTSKFMTALSLVSVVSSSAFAGGLYLREFGQPSQGTAGAGGNILAEDASTAFQNPAGVFNLEGDSEWMVTGIVLDSSAKFDADDNNTVIGNNGGDAGETLFGGALFHARKLNDKWGVAFSLNSVAGSALEYDDGFVGRYTGDQTELLTVLFSPSVAYKINDELSVSVGLNAIWGQIELEAAIPPFVGEAIPARDGRAKIDDGDDFDVSGRASLLWQPTDDWRFALTYSGETTLDFDGDLEVTLPGPGGGVEPPNIAADVRVVFPTVAAASAMVDLNQNWSLMTRIGWEEWSSLESIPVSTNAAGAVIPLEWDDVWSVSAGFRYKTTAPWTWYGGLAYDSDPGKPETRVAVLPVDEQWRLAGGFTYDLNPKRQLGLSLTYVDLGRARTSVNSPGGQYSGDFSTNELYILGVNYGWR